MEDSHPVRLVVTDDLDRSRLTVFFRLLLSIPLLIWLTIWGIPVVIVLVLNWFATLVAGRSPEGFHNFLAGYLRYTTQVLAYVYLLADPWPGFKGSDAYAVDLEIAPPAPQNRLTVLFRLILAIPAYILASVLGYVIEIIALLGWFIGVILGRMPEGMRNLSAYCLNYQQQTYAYFQLLTGRYPSLSWEGPGSPAPPALEAGTSPGALEPGPVEGEIEPTDRT